MHWLLNAHACSSWQQSFIKQQVPNKQHYHQWVWFNSYNAHSELYYGKCCLGPPCVQDHVAASSWKRTTSSAIKTRYISSTIINRSCMILRESSIGTIVKRCLTSKLTNLSNSCNCISDIFSTKWEELRIYDGWQNTAVLPVGKLEILLHWHLVWVVYKLIDLGKSIHLRTFRLLGC